MHSISWRWRWAQFALLTLLIFLLNLQSTACFRMHVRMDGFGIGHCCSTRRNALQRIVGLSHFYAAAVSYTPFVAGASESGLSRFVSADKSFGFEYPMDLKISNKPIKTHLDEVLLQSPTKKGFQCGVVVRRARLPCNSTC
jgi:hypothetical protein